VNDGISMCVAEMNHGGFGIWICLAKDLNSVLDMSS
jgi:hypothetical protein